MNFSIPWDTAFEQSPSGAESISGGDDRIRELKLAIRERVQDGWWEELEVPVYLSPNSFYLAGDKTGRYIEGRIIAIYQNGLTVKTSAVSATYDNGANRTEIVVADEVLESSMSRVFFAAEATGLIKIPNPIEYTAGDNVIVENYVISVPIPKGWKLGGDFSLLETAGESFSISPGSFEHEGKWYSWEGLTFTTGINGDNPNSDILPNEGFTYIYIDHDALPADPSTPLVAANFLNKNTPPSFDASKNSWLLDGIHRCIGCMYAVNGALIPQVKQGNLHRFRDFILEIDVGSGTDSVHTFKGVPPSGIATTVNFAHSLHNSTAVEIRFHIYNVYGDDDTVGLGNILETGEPVTRIGGIIDIAFAYPHNKLRLRAICNGSYRIRTHGFTYHYAI